MGLYEGIKDVAKVVQQADNVDLYLRLLDLGSQALEMQNEISRLREENKKLKEYQDLSKRIIRHSDPYITLKDETLPLYYCSHCWDVDKLLVQLDCNDYDGSFKCPHCKMQGVYDKTKAFSASTDWIDSY